jgi:hypothetical protein
MSINRAIGAAILAGALLAGLQPSWADNQTFGGFECPIDCKGHRAGFIWAHESHVPNESGCVVGSKEFIEGCRVYIDNPLRDPDLDDAGAKIDW